MLSSTIVRGQLISHYRIESQESNAPFLTHLQLIVNVSLEFKGNEHIVLPAIEDGFPLCRPDAVYLTYEPFY